MRKFDQLKKSKAAKIEIDDVIIYAKEPTFRQLEGVGGGDIHAMAALLATVCFEDSALTTPLFESVDEVFDLGVTQVNNLAERVMATVAPNAPKSDESGK